jgi:hypothetical protein
MAFPYLLNEVLEESLCLYSRIPHDRILCFLPGKTSQGL